MKRLTNSLALLMLLVFFASMSMAQTQRKLEGNWIGAVDVGIKMRLAFKVTRNNEKYTAKFDSIDQGALDLDVDSVILEGDTVKFIAPKLSFTYEGKLNATGDEITGSLKQGAAALPLVLKRVTDLPALGRPQDPKKPFPY